MEFYRSRFFEQLNLDSQQRHFPRFPPVNSIHSNLKSPSFTAAIPFISYRSRDNVPPVQCHRNERCIFSTATGRRLSEQKSSVTTCRANGVSLSSANKEFQPLLFQMNLLTLKLPLNFHKITWKFYFQLNNVISYKLSTNIILNYPVLFLYCWYKRYICTMLCYI